MTLRNFHVNFFTLILCSQSGCFEAPKIFQTPDGDATLIDAASETGIDGTVDESGAVSGTFDPNSGDVQVLSIGDSDSELSGVMLKVFPGTFTANTTLKLEEGSSLTNSLQVSAANTGTVTSRSVALVVKPSTNKDPIRPFALTIPLSSTGLSLGASENLAVAFKYIKYSENEKVYLGVIPASDLTVKSDTVEFQTPYFGAFQVVETEKPITQSVILKSSEAVVTKTEEIANTTGTTTPTPTPTQTPADNFALDYFPVVYVSNNMLSSGQPTQLKLNGTTAGDTYTFSNIQKPDAFSPLLTITAAGVITATSGTTPALYSGFSVDVTNTRTGKVKTFGFNVDVYSTATAKKCVWRGWVDSDYGNLQNWDFCGSAVPNNTDWVSVDDDAFHTLTVTGSRVFESIVKTVYSGNSSIKINAGGDISGLYYIEENIAFVASSATCETCLVKGPSAQPLTVKSGAILTLNPGITIELGPGRSLDFGTSGSSSGHLIANWTGTGKRPRVMGSSTANSFGGLFFWGISASKSQANIAGLEVQFAGASSTILNFHEDYQINQLDNVLFTDSGVPHTGAAIRFASCASGVFTDLTWTNLVFDLDLSTGPGYSVANTCNLGELAQAIDVVGASGTGISLPGTTRQSDNYGFILFDGNN